MQAAGGVRACGRAAAEPLAAVLVLPSTPALLLLGCWLLLVIALVLASGTHVCTLDWQKARRRSRKPLIWGVLM